MKKYLLYFSLIKFLFLLTSINGFDRINNGFQRLRESIRGRQQEASADEEGAVGGIEEGVEMMNIGHIHQEACNDFYSYVCNLKDENNQTLVDILENEKSTQFLEISMYTIKDILEETDTGPRYDKLSMEKAWYKACMDRRFSRQAGFNLLSTIVSETDSIRNINNGEEPQVETEHWRAVASIYARRFGESALFKFSINEKKLISIHRPSQWNLIILSDDDVNNKIDLLFDSFSFGGIEDLTETKIRLFHLIKSMIAFLKRIQYSRDILTLEELQENWSFINLTSLLQDVGLNLNALDEVEIDTSYLGLLHSFLHDSTDNDIVNYIHWLYITGDKVKLYWDTSLNSLDNFELSALCLKDMPIKEAIGSIIEKTILKDRKNLIRELFENVRIAFIREVHKSWLTGITKDEALEKLRNVKLTLTNVQYQFSSIEDLSYIFDINFCSLENLMNFNRAQMDYLFTVFRENQPELEFDLISRRKRDLTFNLHADDNVTEIKISVNELLTPLFNTLKPIAWNYGHVATAISYKFTAILDTILHKIRNHILREKHHRRARCFYDSFNKHTGFTMMNMWFLASNCFALKMSYKALNKALMSQTTRENQTLTVFQHLSGRQLFFTSFVAGKCQNLGNKDVVNEAMLHLKGFAQAFKCPPDSLMNPVEKCEMWKSKSKAKRVKTYLQQN